MTEYTPQHTRHDETRPQLLRSLLWVLLTIGVVGNAVASAIGAGIVAHAGFGAVSAVAGVALVTQYLRSR